MIPGVSQKTLHPRLLPFHASGVETILGVIADRAENLVTRP